MYLYIFRYFFIVCLFWFSGLFFIAVAQSPFYLEYSNTPKANNLIELNIASATESIRNITSVDWYVNGSLFPKYKNSLSLSFILENDPVDIQADVRFSRGVVGEGFYRVQRTVTPVIFDVLWEGVSVVPRGYRGYKLVAPNSPFDVSVKIIYKDASGEYDEDDFLISWRYDFVVQETGLGFSKIRLNDGISLRDQYKDIVVEAKLKDDTNVRFTEVIRVRPVTPRVLGYLNSLEFGLVETTISKTIRPESFPFTVSLYPYYYTKTDFEKNSIQYNWFVNAEKNYSKQGRKVDIDIEGKESLTIPFNVRVENENNSSQRSSFDFNVIF